jgi:alkanesulfonate monooxygenase SsuD/methylene tetrahydromethanopterin reductase-like flavin-dependent oxidoreductase (luciferase family)
MSRVRLGVTLPSFVDDPHVPLAVAGAAEDAGLDGVFAFDHLFRRTAAGRRRPALEPVAVLGAVAAATSRITVGSLVFRAWLRPAASLAAAIGSILRIAPGRVVAAMGAGDSLSRIENETFGLGFGTIEDRVARLDAAVRRTRELGAPVWVGGHDPRVRDIAATSADGWNSWGTDLDEFSRLAERLRGVAVHDPFVCSWGGLCVIDDDDDAAQRKAARLAAPSDAIVGGPETLAREIRALADAGADWVVLGPVDSSDAQNAVRLAAEVLPRLG